MYKIFCGIAAAAAVLAATPALAGKADFPVCDGYPAPKKKADGLLSAPGMFGMGSVSTEYRRKQSALGATALPACERALADPLLLPGFWLRRAHLLQAKAVHLIADKNEAAALMALEQSDAAGAPHGDPLFADSIALGNRALRALALYRLGRSDAARTELDALDRARPFAHSLRALGRAIRLVFEEGVDTWFDLLERDAPYEPTLLQSLFRSSMVFAKFPQAAALYGQISFDLPRGRGNWIIEGAEQHKYQLISDRAELAGAMAYALTTQGKAEAAAALLAEARKDIVDATQPPTIREGRQAVTRPDQEDYDKRVAAGQKGTTLIEAWERAIALRAEAAATPLEALGPKLQAGLSRESPVVVDIVQQAQADNEAERASVNAMAAMLRSTIERSRRAALKLTLLDLVKMLPRPEAARIQPRYKSAGDGFFLGDADGFYRKKHPDSDLVSVRYGSTLASPAMVEELGMLSAAMQAKAAGKDSFLIQSRMLMHRTTRVYGYGKDYSEFPSGNEVRLTILPVSAAALPAELETSRWRLIDAQRVYDSLHPKYAALPQRVAGSTR